MIGSVIGNFKVTEKLGAGGMGEVFKGLDLMLEREVAIKMLRPELASQPQVVARFRSEAITLARLQHPNVATLYSFLRQGDDFFMIMEFVPGEGVDSFIHRLGALPFKPAIRIFCQAMEGIAHAHNLGVVHRDIKPANVMITPDGTVKVMDFGIARVLGSAARMTREGAVIGTIEYMSPEQVRGELTDQRSDIYSLGILLYEMLTGRAPFNSQSEYELMRAQIELPPPPPRELVPDVPEEIERIVLRALAKNPLDRFQSAADFRVALMPFQTIADTGVLTRQINDPKMETEALVAAKLGETVKETRIAQAAVPAALQTLPLQQPTVSGNSDEVIAPDTVLEKTGSIETQITPPDQQLPLTTQTEPLDPAHAQPTVLDEDLIKPTRLVAEQSLDAGATNLLPEDFAAPGFTTNITEPPDAERQPKLPIQVMSRFLTLKQLSWKHYSGIAAVLIFIVVAISALKNDGKTSVHEVSATPVPTLTVAPPTPIVVETESPLAEPTPEPVQTRDKEEVKPLPDEAPENLGKPKRKPKPGTSLSDKKKKIDEAIKRLDGQKPESNN